MNLSVELKKTIDEQEWASYGVVSYAELKRALAQHEGIFEKWVAKGYQADMDYLERMKGDRFHPENKLPEIKSVIVLMAWYGVEQKNCSSDEGRVARYAAGKDYHKILKKRLLALSDWLKAQSQGAETYLSVDSGPTVDRVLAETAGLGFFGKNSMLIDPRRGSYFFIASLMTNLELPVTEKRRMPSCGSCQKCFVACPTDAIVAPGVIDARRCISYLTIENKQGIPEEFREKLGNRLFGCDICQEVCPFNEGRAGRKEVLVDELKADFGVGESLSLVEVLQIDSDEAFLKRFAGTPVMRAGRRGLLRNACVVAGNSGEKTLLEPLRQVLEREGDEMLREHAEWAIEKIENAQ
ncbi:MAG: tRNA epoxyqueuosine(34) reductase QueG [Candidatus Peregrinibacteria bacterium]|nr:tRNA epoxyqueuosine(34) reductase QueG [Candidatus Peregrinibacteria bacterium]